MNVLTSGQHDDLRILLDSPCTPEQQIVEIANLLTLPQIKQLAEQHNASVVEWIEFDADDESTYPNTEYTDQFITNIGCCAFTENDWVTLDTDSYYTNRPANYVTHWAYLPQPKGL